MQAHEQSDGIIQPRRAKSDPHLKPDVLMVMIPGELHHLAQYSGAEKAAFSNMRLYDLYRTKAQSQSPVTIAGPFIGAPHAVMGMEKLIAMGARRFLMMGWCGSIQPHLGIGDLVIPTYAISEEGTSRHYPTSVETPMSDEALNRVVEMRLERENTPFTKGPIWTTDAIYRETPEKVKRYQKRGILAVEMEVSALLAVAAFREVCMAALLVVSDELFQLKWRPGFNSSRLKERSRAAALLLLEAHQRLAGTEEVPGGERS